jgi:hypothetical protein
LLINSQSTTRRAQDKQYAGKKAISTCVQSSLSEPSLLRGNGGEPQNSTVAHPYIDTYEHLLVENGCSKISANIKAQGVGYRSSGGFTGDIQSKQC